MTELLQKYLLPLLHYSGRLKPWGSFHILFFALGLPIAVGAAYLLRRLSGRAQRRLYLSVGTALIVSEIFKQLAYVAVEGYYRFDLIPFQLCSIPMYLCILIGLLPEGGFTRAARTFISTYGLMGGIASFVAPGSMLRDYYELTVHSFLWHLTLIFLGFFIIFTADRVPTRRDLGNSVLLYLTLCVIAFSINVICMDAPGRDVNMFYIGPKPSALPLCGEITERFGVAVNSMAYISALSACAALIFLAERIIIKRKR